jgi:magnesium-transporting ATPase (P-type)
MKWCLLGIIHSVVPFYFTWGAWGYGEGAIEKSGDIPSLWMSSVVVYTVEILLVSIVTMYVSASWTQLLVWSTLLLNVVAYFLFVFVYDYVKIPGTGVYPVYRIAVSTMGNFQFWVIIAITLLVSLAPIYWYKQLSKFRKSHIPSFVEAVMETKNRSRPVSQTQPTV